MGKVAFLRGLGRRLLPVTGGGAAGGANVQPGQPASCSGHGVGGLTGEGEVSLLPADGDSYHAGGPGVLAELAHEALLAGRCQHFALPPALMYSSSSTK